VDIVVFASRPVRTVGVWAAGTGPNCKRSEEEGRAKFVIVISRATEAKKLEKGRKKRKKTGTSTNEYFCQSHPCSALLTTNPPHTPGSITGERGGDGRR
jgi:hypothetical protein